MLRFAIVGAAKTGSTFLANMLDRQPDVGVMWESSWYNAEIDSCILRPNENARRNGFPLGSRVSGQYDPAYRERAEAAFQEFAERRGCTIVGDKRWDYLWWWPRVSAWYPDLVAIYNTRHPCGVWLSGQTFRDRGIGDIAVRRLLQVDELYRHHSQYGGQWFRTSYEALCEVPELVVLAIDELIRDDGLLAYARLEREAPDPLPDRWYWIENASAAPDAARASRWAAVLTPEQKDHVYGLPGVRAYCDRYGYLTDR